MNSSEDISDNRPCDNWFKLTYNEELLSESTYVLPETAWPPVGVVTWTQKSSSHSQSWLCGVPKPEGKKKQIHVTQLL